MNLSNNIVYYDALLTNEVIVNNNPPICSYTDTRSAPLLRDSTGYSMSIVRFTLSTQTLPIFIPTVLDKVNAPNNTIYSFTMSYNGTVYQQFLQYEPQVNTNPSDDEYYYVFTYSFLTYLINKCLQSCLEGLVQQIPELSNAPVPVLTYSIDTQKYSITFDTDYYGFNEDNKINVYLNYSMMSILDTMAIYITRTNIQGQNYLLDLRQCDANGTLFQELSTCGNINPVSSILMTSNYLPALPNQVGNFNTIVDGINNSGSSNNACLSVITDFVGSDLLFTPFIQYTPYTYLWISLRPGTEIKNVDIQAYWRSKKTGEIHPIYLSSGGSFTLKLAFQKIA